MKDYGYTLVQHNAWGYGGNPQFMRGLQEALIEGKVNYNKVVKAGGMILPDYVTADKMAEELMYPEGYEGIIPNASGGFSKLKIDDLHIYVPLEEIRRREALRHPFSEPIRNSKVGHGKCRYSIACL